MSVSPVRDRDGAIVGVASISRAVSAEERSATLLAALLDAAPDAVICVGEDGRVVAANARVTDLFGHDRDALVGARLETLVPDHVAEQHVDHRRDWFAAPHTRPMGLGLDLTGRRRDGTTFPVAVSLAPARVDGTPLVVAAIRDVTQGRDAAERLRVSEERLRLLAENVEAVSPSRHWSHAASSTSARSSSGSPAIRPSGLSTTRTSSPPSSYTPTTARRSNGLRTSGSGPHARPRRPPDRPGRRRGALGALGAGAGADPRDQRGADRHHLGGHHRAGARRRAAGDADAEARARTRPRTSSSRG